MLQLARLIGSRFCFALVLALPVLALPTLPTAHAFSPASLAFPFIPDPSQTVGSMCDEANPDFTEHRYKEKIPYCVRNVSSDLKRSIYSTYRVPTRCRGEYTIDHFIPLSLGGTNERDNLWPEHKSIKFLRQNLEMNLYNRLSKGEITQAQAVQEIVQAKLDPPVEKLGDLDNFAYCH